MRLQVKEKQRSKDGTVKFLFDFNDGILAETVCMFHDYGVSVCVSSQAGCNMACAFCASGLKKKIRDLTAEEMFAQLFSVQAFLQEEETASSEVSRVVVMGTGEPFDNYDEVVRFCDIVSEEKKPALFLREEEGFVFPAIAPRHITVSTCGLVPKIRDFAALAKRYNLAISLHAPDDETRNKLMPVNRKYPMEELIRAAAEYCRSTKRRVAFEYILLDGINDSSDAAQRLAAFFKKNASSELAEKYFYVNLIPYNAVNEFGFQASSKECALRFYDALMKNGIKATLRKERGSDITAACGQLRAKEKRKTT